jgi:hypothetical protein
MAALPSAQSDLAKDAESNELTPEEVAEMQETLIPITSCEIGDCPSDSAELTQQEAAEMQQKLEELKALFQSHEDQVEALKGGSTAGETQAERESEADDNRTATEERPHVPGTGIEATWLMDDNTIDALLRFYGLPLTGTAVEKRKALVDCIAARI